MKPLKPALAGLAAVTLALSAQVPTASGASFRTAGVNVAHTWAAEYMSTQHSYSRTEAIAMAKRFDVVAATPNAFRDHVAAMKAANPDIHLLSYANAMFANSHVYAGLPESAFAHSLGGGHIKSRAFGVTLMEPSSPAWRTRSAAACAAAAQRGNYEGCLMDMLTMGIYSKGYVTALPKKPGTNRLYTESEWRSQLVGVINTLKSQLSGKAVVGNSVGNTFRYFDASVTSQPLSGSLAGAQMEDFLRGARDGVSNFPSESEWMKNVRVIKDFEAAGRTGLFGTKLWVSASRSMVAQWQAYAMATFLMGANGNTYFAFTPSRDKAGASGTNHPYRMPSNLGAPTSGMVDKGVAYMRTFTNGAAVVNPTGSATTVKLSSTMTTLGGSRVSSVKLAPHSGQVLTRS